MALLFEASNADTGAMTHAAQVIAINYRRGVHAIIEVGLYVSQEGMAAGKTPVAVQTVVFNDGALALLEAAFEPTIETAIISTPTFSTGSRVA